MFKHRGYQRKLIYMWKVVINQKSVKYQPETPMFYFISYIWLQNVFGSDTDPSLQLMSNKTLPTVYMPNYLTVSEKPKYSQFYHEANKKLTFHIKGEIFNSWKSQTKKIVEFRKNKQRVLLTEIIHFWSEYSTQKLIQKSKLDTFRAQRTRDELQRIFDGMKSYLGHKADLTNRVKFWKALQEAKTTKDYFWQWKIKYRKSIISQEQNIVADRMYRKKHLGVFYQWHEKFIRYQQLNREDYKLKVYQDTTLLQKCWRALVQNTEDERWQKAADKAAISERAYWLAKRAFNGWKDQIDNLKQKNDLYRLLDTHHHMAVKKSVLATLQKFVEFKQEQRYNDLLVTNEIVKIRQRNILRKWEIARVKNCGAKKLVLHCETAVKKIVLRGMIERYNYQNSIMIYMRSQRTFYIELTAFNRLKAVMLRNKRFVKVNKAIECTENYWNTKKTMSLCNSSEDGKSTKENVFLLMRIKDNLVRQCFQAFRTHTKYQKEKKQADQYYEQNLKKKLLNTVYNKRALLDRDFQLTYQISSKMTYKTKSSVLQAWKELYEELHAKRVKVESFISTRNTLKMTNMLSAWKAHTKTKLRINSIYSTLKAKSEHKKLSLGFSSFLKGIDFLKNTKEKCEKADNLYRKIT